MQAMHGFALMRRRRGRVIGCCTVLALALSATLLAAGASAEPPPVKTYLALGPENTFGFTQEKSEINSPNEAPSYFEQNYPNFFAKKLRASKTENNKGLVVVNDGCPGESTDSFIGTGPLGKGVDPEGTAACPYHFVKGLPLHNDLATLSQLEDAIEVLNPCFIESKVCAPPHEIKAVTLEIGGNDELHALGKCIAEVKAEFEAAGKTKYGTKVEESIKVCVLETTEATTKHIAKNVETILGLIRSPSFGNYSGSIVYVGFFNPFTFVLTGSNTPQKLVNGKLEEAVAPFGVKYANPLPVFNPPPEGGAAEEARIGCPAYLVAAKTEEGLPKCKKVHVGTLTEMGNEKVVAVNKAAAEAKNAEEVGEGKTVIFPFNGAGDLHLTPKGAEAFAKVIFANYP